MNAVRQVLQHGNCGKRAKIACGKSQVTRFSSKFDDTKGIASEEEGAIASESAYIGLIGEQRRHEREYGN